jgi:hypothetical protein
MKRRLNSAASKHLVVLLCAFASNAAFGQGFSVGLSAGPSITNLYENGASVVEATPRWSWNAGIELMSKPSQHVEWGIGFNIISHDEEQRQESSPGVSHVENFNLSMYTFRALVGYRTAMGRNTLGVGIHTGLGVVLENHLPGNCTPLGVNAGFYFRYGYVLSDKFDLTAAIQPTICPSPSFVSMPIAMGVAYKFRGPHKPARVNSEPAKTTHRKAPPPFPPPLPPLPWRRRSAENATPRN